MPHPYYGSWSTLESVQHSFRRTEWDSEGESHDVCPVLDTDEILFAAYGGQGYEGDAVLLFRRDGTLYFVHGSHCSCNGLEECWDPEEVSTDAAVKLITGRLFSERYDNQYNEEYEDDARLAWLRVAVNLGHGHLLSDHAEFVLKHMAKESTDG